MTVSSAIMPGAKGAADARWIVRRRWARAGLVYFFLLVFSLVFIAPLVLGTLSSLKTDPLEQPPRLLFEQLYPRNWGSAWSLGVKGSGNGFMGGFSVGADVPFSLSYLVPAGAAPTAPIVTVSRRRPGTTVVQPVYAADYSKISPVTVSANTPALMPDGKAGRLVTFEFHVAYPKPATGAAPHADRLPVDVASPEGYVFKSAPLDPTFREQNMIATPERPYTYPRSQTFDNITPGVINYVFRNYVRIFEQTRSYTTGESLFLKWILNSALLVVLVVTSTVIIASLGGYALARFKFPGKDFLFIFILFTMTLPGQVTFISNYLVLRDGIWGLSRLWGQATLLNSVIGLWAVMFASAGGVFLMKQFFESLPRELEEAATIDGASALQTFVRVIMPNAGPALIALVITTAQGAWNQYFWAAVVLQTPDDRFTLPIGINQFQRAYGATGDYGLLLAGAVFSAVPVIILFIVFQRYFVEGVSFSGGKE